MNLVIKKLSELKNEGKQIAFVLGNRDIAKANLKNKKESLARCGMNLVPIMVVEGTKAVEDDCTLVNPSDGKSIPRDDASKYVAIVDGQHRYTAYLELVEDAKKKQKEAKTDSVTNGNTVSDDNTVADGTLPELFFYLDYSTMKTNELLTITNIDCYKWEAKDYAKGAILADANDSIVKFASEWTDKDMKLSVVSLYLYGKNNKINKRHLAKVIESKPLGIKEEAQLDMAKAIVPKLVDKLGKFAKTRYCADAVWAVIKKKGTNTIPILTSAVDKISDDVISYIKKYGGDEGQNKLEETLLDLCKQE